MAVRYCQLHLIGFNDELDAVCPQCLLAQIPPAADHPTKEHALAAREAVRLANAPKSPRPA